ncbi:MAG: hypothetical protein ACFNL4_01155 [Corynebacterium matruchotii]|jgi:hypothetical protein
MTTRKKISKKKTGKRNRKQPLNLEQLEAQAYKEMAKSRAMIDEGLTTGQHRKGRQKSPGAYRSKYS